MDQVAAMTQELAADDGSCRSIKVPRRNSLQNPLTPWERSFMSGARGATNRT
jgi:hypothetical protein